MRFLLTLKNEGNILTYDILIAPFGSIGQTNGRKSMDSGGTINSTGLDFATTRAKVNDSQLRKEITLWKDNDYLCKKSHSEWTHL